MVALPPGQAQGPLIHPTPLLVPTERWRRKRPQEHEYPIRSSKFIGYPGYCLKPLYRGASEASVDPDLSRGERSVSRPRFIEGRAKRGRFHYEREINC